MRRLFWLALGASLGVLIFRKLTQAAEKLTPQGIAASFGSGLSELAASIRDFADDVRDSMSAQESALRSAAGLDAAGSELAGTATAGATTGGPDKLPPNAAQTAG